MHCMVQMPACGLAQLGSHAVPQDLNSSFSPHCWPNEVEKIAIITRKAKTNRDIVDSFMKHFTCEPLSLSSPSFSLYFLAVFVPSFLLRFSSYFFKSVDSITQRNLTKLRSVIRNSFRSLRKFLIRQLCALSRRIPFVSFSMDNISILTVLAASVSPSSPMLIFCWREISLTKPLRTKIQ